MSQQANDNVIARARFLKRSAALGAAVIGAGAPAVQSVLAAQPSANLDTRTAANAVTLNVVSSWNQVTLPNWPGLVKQFNSSHPSINAKLSFVTGDSAIQKLSSEFISGTAPDVVQVFKKDFNSYQQKGLLLDQSSFFKKNGWYDNYFNPGALRWASPLNAAFSTSRTPAVYGIPDFMQPSVFYYNLNVFRKHGLQEPTTLAELIAVSRKLKAAGIKPLVVDGATSNGLDILAKTAAQFAGAQELLKIYNGRAKFTDQPMMAAANAVETLIHTGVLDKTSTGLTQTECESLVANGQAAMFSLHASVIPDFNALEKQDSKFKYSVLKGVKFTSKPVTEYSVTFGGLWVIPQPGKNAKAAEQFLQYMFTPAHTEQTCKASGKISDNLHANYGFSDPVIRKITRYMIPHIDQQSFYLIDMVASQVLDNLTGGLQDLLSGKINAKTWMTNAQTTMDQVLSQQ